MKRGGIRVWIIVSLLIVDMPLFAFFSRYRQDNITIYSVFGYHWGWDNSKPLSEQEIEFLIEKFEAERKEHAVQLQRKKKRKELNSAPKKQNAFYFKDQNAEDFYKIIGTQPSHMIYIESCKSFMRSTINRWFFEVAWNDDQAPQQVSVINETGETLFVEANDNPYDLMRPKQLKGVLNGHARRVALILEPSIAVWRMQITDERLEQLVTQIKIPYGTTLVRLSKNHGKIITHMIDGSEDEEVV